MNPQTGSDAVEPDSRYSAMTSTPTAKTAQVRHVTAAAQPLTG